MSGPGPLAVLPMLAAVLLAAEPQRSVAPLHQKEAERQVVSLALALQKAARAGDAEALLAMVDDAGVPCAGGTISRERFAADLRTPGTRIHEFFLGNGQARAGTPAAPHPSLRQLFGERRNVRIVVRFTEVEVAKLSWERPCVVFRVEGESYAPRLCLLHRSGHYTLADLGDGC